MKQSSALAFLYHTAFGRMILKPLTRPFVSRTVGKYMDSRLSRHRIKGFVRSNGIDMSEYVPCEYGSFNEFFRRQIKPEVRPIAPDGSFVCPADSRLSAYEITPELCFFVKGAPYSVGTLLGGDSVAEEYAGGSCLVFHLCVDDYHRYGYFDSGRTLCKPKHIDGVLHTVNPISLGKYNFFHQNSREYTVLETKHFGKAVYCEIGALMVGRIVNHEKEAFSAGEEKGYFEFGGSTVIVLLKRGFGVARRFYENTKNGEETRVKYGEAL